MEWRNGITTRGYRYEYDAVKQLKVGSYGTVTNSSWSMGKAYAERDITYDLNGNITTLTRTNSSEEPLHAINNTYTGNQLSRTNINGSNYAYTYDTNGNMISDGYKGVNIAYNILDLPSKIFAGTDEVSYIYRADGTKLATKVGNSYTYYRGSFVYNDAELDHILHPEGVIRKASGGYVYHYAKKDHLGSTRVLCHEANGKMMADQTTDYYPFGLSFRSNSMNVNRYLFSGKELQDQVVNGNPLQLYDFGARNYDPILGRWFNIDPHANKYYSVSPYTYVLNTPVNAIDPDGKLVIFVNGFHFGDGGAPEYWEGLDNAVMGFLNDNNAKYYDGSIGGFFGLFNYNGSPHLVVAGSKSNYSANRRYEAGYARGKNDASLLLDLLSDGEKIKVITHSMGAMYAKGLIQGMIDNGVNPSLFAFEADFAPFQPIAQKAVNDVDTYQYSHPKDPIAGGDPIKGAHYMNTGNDKDQGHGIDGFWEQVGNLPSGSYVIVNGKITPMGKPGVN